MKRLRAALMGLKDVGLDYLAAIQADDQFELVAIADADPRLLYRHVEQSSLRGFEDPRSMIVETAHAGLDVLFIALESFESYELVELAVERGLAVFHKAPPARSLREAIKLLQPFQQRNIPFVVARHWYFEPAFGKLGLLSELIGRVHAASANIRTADQPVGWRGDSLRAGGGVLLNGAYETIDMLTCLMGTPEEVFAQSSETTPPASPRKHDTEDAVCLTLRFAGDRIGSVAVANGNTEASGRVLFSGARGCVELHDDRMIHAPPGGPPQQYKVRTKQRAAPAISALGNALCSADEPIRSTMQDHLATLAVIEAAYLSAKTGSPESPKRLLRQE